MKKNNKIPSDNMRILVVDDDKSIREVIQEAIIHFGYDCSIAEDGIEALKVLEQKNVDVVITDILMPNMNGIELTKAIKEKYDCDVIIMTGFVKDYTYEDIIEIGASDFTQKPVSIKELLIRIKRVLKERALIAERICAEEALRESEKRYQELSITDGLTNLYNLRHFYDQLELEIERTNRYNHLLTLLLLDIDDFKLFNDKFGHLDGDTVLVELANIIRKSMRQTDSAFRYGGDEFVVILPETNVKQGLVVAERIRAGMNKIPFTPVKGKTVHATLSIGLTQYTLGEELKNFIKRTDKAMYRAKERGKNQIFM
jgi:diguanylate cyclase (GGDEF)-like protein